LVTYHELAAALRGLGMTNTAEIDTLMKNMDTDGDGQISWCRWDGAVSLRHLPNNAGPHSLRALFLLLQGGVFAGHGGAADDPPPEQRMVGLLPSTTRTATGKISVDELRLALKDEPEDVVRAHIREYDTDGDGTISYEEFIRMLLPKSLNFKLAAAVGASACTSARVLRASPAGVGCQLGVGRRSRPTSRMSSPQRRALQWLRRTALLCEGHGSLRCLRAMIFVDALVLLSCSCSEPGSSCCSVHESSALYSRMHV